MQPNATVVASRIHTSLTVFPLETTHFKDAAHKRRYLLTEWCGKDDAFKGQVQTALKQPEKGKENETPSRQDPTARRAGLAPATSP